MSAGVFKRGRNGMYQAWCATHSDGINVWGKKKADEWAAQLDADYHESETK